MRCLFYWNSSDMGGAIACCEGSAPLLSECLFLENGGDSGGAVACLSASTVTIERCTLAGNIGVGGSGVYVNGTSTLIGERSIIAFGYKGEDPLFCHNSNPSERYSLHSDSPCASESNPDCGGIGALGVGCGATPVRTTTWGRVKALYREAM